MKICLPQDEEFRLQALNSYGILDTPAESDYDDITHLAATICNAPTAIISFVDENRQWFKSCIGLDAAETSRDVAFCAHAILNPNELFIIENALEDERFRNNPMVTGAPYIRFYAGAPLVTPDGFALGSLCVKDYVPRRLSAEQEASLKALARQVVAQLELRRTAQTNSELSERYQQIFSQASDGIIIYDFDGRILQANHKICRITGRTEAELLRMRVMDLIEPEDLREMPIELWKLHDGESRLIQRKFICPDGKLVSVEISCKKIDDNTLQAIIRDLSERRKLEKKLAASQEELRKSQDTFNLFVDNSPTVIFLKDEEGKYVTVNRSYEELFQVKRKELKGKNDFEIFPPEIAESVTANDRLVLETGETLKTVEFVPAPDGTPHYWLSHKFLVRDETGKKFVGGTAVNITERKQMEDELASARDAALESVRLKSAFLANVSHEIRTPMNGVIGITELLLDTPLDHTQRDYAETIRKSADALLTVINDILDLSKIESGKLRFEDSEFDVRETVKSSVEFFAHRAASKNIEIASLIETKIPQSLRGDSGRLRQILTNLVGNAVKFTERGGVKLEAKIESETVDHIKLRFDVIDTGIGIRKNDLNKLFQPFVQIDGSSTRQHGGTGLGLVISKQIVEMMNGEIKAESIFGTGSSFSFTADFAKVENASNSMHDSSLQPFGASPKAETPPAQTPVVNVERDLKLLVVEDNEVNRAVVKRQLERIGIKADIAVNGQEAVEKTAANNYQIILMDCQMPVLDGYLATQEIRRREQTKKARGESYSSVKIIALTAHTFAGEREKCLAAGMNDYLSKPTKIKELSAMIDAWC